jgi:hypothetical protein
VNSMSMQDESFTDGSHFSRSRSSNNQAILESGRTQLPLSLEVLGISMSETKPAWLSSPIDIYQTTTQLMLCQSHAQSAPAYVTDQPAFLNAVIEARTTLAPLDLLRALKVSILPS